MGYGTNAGFWFTNLFWCTCDGTGHCYCLGVYLLLNEYRDSIVGGKEEETDYEDVEIQELIGGFDLKTVDVFKREDRLRATTAKTILRDRKSFEVRTKLHTSQSHGFTNLDPCSCSASTSVQNLHKTRMWLVMSWKLLAPLSGNGYGFVELLSIDTTMTCTRYMSLP